MKTRRSAQPLLMGSDLYEYAFIPVPQNQRKKNSGLFYVLAGFGSALSCLVIGSKVGIAMPFWQAIGACFLGDLVLILIGTCMGMLSARSGRSTAFLAKRVLGKTTSIVFSILIIANAIFWVGVNGNLFATLLITVFTDWHLPFSVTSILIIAVWASSASGGWRGLELASRIVVPCSLLLLLYAMVRLAHQMGDATFLFRTPVSSPMTLAAASTAIIGNFVCGCISTPDTCRYARSTKAVAVICPCAYGIGLFLFHVCGVIVAKAGGFGDFTRSAAALGLLIPMLLCSVFCLATTQNINIYFASLALQNIFQGTTLEGNVSHKTATYLIAGLSAALSVWGISGHMMEMASSFSILMIPLPGMLLGEVLFYQERAKPQGFTWQSIAIWMIGSCTGFLFLHLNLPIAPFWEMLFSGILYVCINKWLDRTSAQRILGKGFKKD